MPTINGLSYEIMPPTFRIKVPPPLMCGHVTPLDVKPGDVVRCIVCKSDREVM